MFETTRSARKRAPFFVWTVATRLLLDVDPGHLVLEQDVAARVLSDRVDDRADQTRVVAARVVGALSVGDDESRVEQERDLRGRQQVVATLTREDRSHPRREPEPVVELTERRLLPAQQSGKAERRRQEILPRRLFG